MEGDSATVLGTLRAIEFQSTPSAWRETGIAKAINDTKKFQSTPSAWRETGSYVQEYSPLKFQSTPSAWRETLFVLYHRFQTFHFNPLPPHGGRHGRGFRITLICNFNPLPPHGGRLRQCLLSTTGELFQSTPSAWRETSAFSKTRF